MKYLNLAEQRTSEYRGLCPGGTKMRTYNYKEQLLGDVMDFCEAKVAGDRREMEERVNSIFQQP